jgi:septal ring factor EnvC (AmiA/AmiB activator)
MTRLLAIFFLVALTARAQSEPTITKEDLRKTLEHIQSLAKENEMRSITAEDNERQTLRKLEDANQSIGGLKTEVTHLADDRDKQAANAAYWQQKQKEAVKKLWWWRLWAGGALFLGIGLLAVMLLTKFTSWGAKTFGPIITKVTTGI